MTAAQDPLAGRTVLVTRTRERAGGIVDLLHARGARVVLVPLISTVPLLHPEAIAEAAAELGRAPERCGWCYPPFRPKRWPAVMSQRWDRQR